MNVLMRIRVTFVWLFTYSSLFMGIAFLSISIIQFFGTTAKDISFPLSVIFTICMFTLFGILQLVWARIIFTENDLKVLSANLGGRIYQDRFMVGLSLKNVRMLFPGLQKNFWRFDLFWMNPRRRPIWRWLQKKRETSASTIESRHFSKLIRAACPVVIVIDKNSIGVLESTRIRDELSSRYPEREFETWLQRDENGNRTFLRIQGDSEVNYHDFQNIYLLAYLPPWEKMRIEAVIRNTWKRVKTFNSTAKPVSEFRLE